ncbi:MAG: hypothetical protein PWP27_1983 [Clostridiales bacterium]|jgi:uncharacterized membrane protein|nr:hypothetical protein [Clostridiales bacterium]MDK2934173.1 hypothetical protein [Clostridiales bacterium]
MKIKRRIWEIDFIRGIAIVLMVVFHLVVDLKDFYSYDIEYLSGFWYYVGKLSAILFILISGVSSTFSKHNIKRGSVVFSFGLLLSVITFFYSPKDYIKFGILHFLGTSMILYHFLNKLEKKYIFLLGTTIIILGNIFSNIVVNTPYLFPFGLIDKNFSSLDYYSLFPWFGLFLYGTLIAKTLYIEKKSLFSFEIKHDFISYLGQHSLFIYLTHQPLLLGILFIVHKLC